MQEIRSALERATPELKERLLPTEYGDYRGTRIEPDILKYWRRIKDERGHIGLQYPVLASYAIQNEIRMLELSVEARSNSHSTVMSILEPVVEMRESPAGPVARLADNIKGPEAMFSRFTFPLIKYTKLDMKEEAERRRWMPILEKTQFCFNPTFGRPCGFCIPCKVASKEGLGYRVGYFGALMSPFVHPRERLVALLEQVGAKKEVKRVLHRIGLK
jgi:hypothetical protein